MTLPPQGPGRANNGNSPPGVDAAKAVYQPQHGGLPPGPVPTTYNVGQTQLSNGQIWVFLRVDTPTGTCITFMPPESAGALGKELSRLAAAGQILLGGTDPRLGG